MSSQGKTEENLAPMIRIRSQSATEASKPMSQRRSTLTGTKPNFSPSGEFFKNLLKFFLVCKYLKVEK